MTGWIGVDLDGTLAHYEPTPEEEWDDLVIGPPVGPMVRRVKAWLAEGKEVRIVTARVADLHIAATIGQVARVGLIRAAIQDWTEAQGLGRLKVQAHKDHRMVALYDDLAVRVERNTGHIIGPEDTWP